MERRGIIFIFGCIFKICVAQEAYAWGYNDWCIFKMGYALKNCDRLIDEVNKGCLSSLIVFGNWHCDFVGGKSNWIDYKDKWLLQYPGKTCTGLKYVNEFLNGPDYLISDYFKSVGEKKTKQFYRYVIDMNISGNLGKNTPPLNDDFMRIGNDLLKSHGLTRIMKNGKSEIFRWDSCDPKNGFLNYHRIADIIQTDLNREKTAMYCDDTPLYKNCTRFHNNLDLTKVFTCIAVGTITLPKVKVLYKPRRT